jgi:hypothetical protein
VSEIPENQRGKVNHFDIIKIDKIKIVGDNPNVMTALELQSLQHSIEKFDMLQPILIDQDNNLINGHKRYEACKALGYTTIPVIRTKVDDEIQRLLMIQAFNKIHGKHDDDLDKKIYAMVLQNNQDNMLDLVALTMQEDENRIYEMLNPKSESEYNKTRTSEKQSKKSKDVTCPNCEHQFTI